MFCKKCGTKLSKTAQFCHKCGTKTDVPQIKLSKKTMAIVGAIALIFLLTFGIVTLIDNLSDSQVQEAAAVHITQVDHITAEAAIQALLPD